MGDLSRRRGQIKENKINANGTQVIRSNGSLSEMFGYTTDLHSMISGHGNYQIQFDYYEKTPRNIENEIIKKMVLF